jgi:hypothetical protein
MLSRRLFRHRRIRRLFPIGCVVAFLFGIVAAPSIGLSSGVFGTLVFGAVLGLIGSVGVYFILRFRDQRL